MNIPLPARCICVIPPICRHLAVAMHSRLRVAAIPPTDVMFPLTISPLQRNSGSERWQVSNNDHTLAYKAKVPLIQRRGIHKVYVFGKR